MKQTLCVCKKVERNAVFPWRFLHGFSAQRFPSAQAGVGALSQMSVLMDWSFFMTIPLHFSVDHFTHRSTKTHI